MEPPIPAIATAYELATLLPSMIGQRLFFHTPGLSGYLERVRADGVLDVRLPFGSGHFHASSVYLPMERFPTGAEVVTQFGRGRVLSVEMRPSVGVVYVLAMLDCRLTDDPKTGGKQFATGYFASPSVSKAAPEAPLLKCIADMEAVREKGNQAFKSKDYGAAIAAYETANKEVIQAVRGFPDGLRMSEELRSQLTEVLVKGHSNLAISYNNRAVELSPPAGDHAMFKLAIQAADTVRLKPPPSHCSPQARTISSSLAHPC
jgi:hypothetical protein